jgi:hypothetical protein
MSNLPQYSAFPKSFDIRFICQSAFGFLPFWQASGQSSIRTLFAVPLSERSRSGRGNPVRRWHSRKRGQKQAACCRALDFI